MSLFSKLLAFSFVFMMLACVLFVVFGQVTVRKLRKSPKTKDALGLEFTSGWDIINVAQALAFPLSWSKKLEQSQLSFLHANATILRENTTRFAHFLGSCFYWVMFSSVFTSLFLIFLNSIGVFTE